MMVVFIAFRILTEQDRWLAKLTSTVSGSVYFGCQIAFNRVCTQANCAMCKDRHTGRGRFVHTVTYAVTRAKGVCAFVDMKDYIFNAMKWKVLSLDLDTETENALFEAIQGQERKPFNTGGLLLAACPFSLVRWGTTEPALEAADRASSWFCSELLSCLLGSFGVIDQNFIPCKTTPGQLHDMLVRSPACHEYNI